MAACKRVLPSPMEARTRDVGPGLLPGIKTETR
jgi:hypothetical protein